MTYRTLCEKLEAKNFRVTVQRGLVLRLFLNGKHLTAEDVVTQIQHFYPQISRGTIMRIIEKLVELGMLHKVNFKPQENYYELLLEDNYHHHLICANCGEIVNLPPEIFGSLEKTILNETGYQIGPQATTHPLQLFGLCSKCRKEKNLLQD